ncbi:putative Transcriptional regulator [Candidatus Promineifilum breve]|uniref:Transcriptional regulator n=1 Tax=Candidatus Promineifilum breve TaxID=1806508 RepID=A0A160T2V0_9CHLR|nr:GntR family transcriptional regulator [Candidatus Promineifilum breve]CUS03238.2 putative Transcriptional regulator [Candidatus Promineifilum breve]
MLRRAPSLTDQVKTHIKDLILQGEFPGGRIPPEMELAEALGVSRTTVRDALSRLEMEGTISRRQGAGTFVNNPVLQIHSRLEEIWGYEAMLEAHGFTPSTRLIETLEISAGDSPYDAATAGDLQLAPDEPLVLVTKLFLENDAPVILTRNSIPRRLIAEPYQADDLGRPLYEFLEQFSRQRLSYYVTDIVPLAADAITADLLKIDPGTPLVSFDEIGYDDSNMPIVKAHSYFRDDLLRLRLLRRRV